MKYKVLYVALTVLVLLVVTDARKTTGSRNRGSSTGSRTTNRGKVHYPPSAPPAPSSNVFSQSRPSSGHGFSQSKPAPKVEEHRPVGWQVSKKETPVHKDVAQTQHAAYPGATHGLSGSGAAQGSHSYPSSGTFSGNSPSNQQSPVQQSHSYPQNSQPNQQSGTNNLHVPSYPSNNQQSHTYPNNVGLSGHSGSAPPGYPSQSGTPQHGSPPAYPGHQPTHQGAPPAYPGQQGIHQGAPPAYPVGGTALNHPSGYPGQGHPSYPQQAPAYPGYGGIGNGYGGGYGGMGGGYGGGYGAPGGFGGYNAYGSGSRGSSALTGLGIAGAGAGTLLTGLALWNIARSTGGGSRHSSSPQHNVYNTYNTYNNNDTHAAPGTGAFNPAGPNAPAIDPVLGELVNCTLTVSATNASEVLAIPCAIATSVASANHEKLPEGTGTETKCIVTVVNTNGTEFQTSIPCSILTGLAAKAEAESPFPQPTVNCTLPAGLTPDPINPCMPLDGDVTVVPLPVAPQGSTPAPVASVAPDAPTLAPAPTTAPAA